MNKLTINDIDWSGKKAIVRVDFNVPLDDSGHITDDMRIQAALPTIQHILQHHAAKVILMSHLGRPEGQIVESMRLTPVAKRLQELLRQPVLRLDDCVGPAVKKSLEAGREKVVLLENLRFHKAETKNDPAFAKQLAELADIYVNDAFGTAHRAHASTEGIAKYLPAVAGLLMETEIHYLGKAVHNPQRPFAVILGGAKVSDKIPLIENLLPKADSILIGGGMAYTFLKALGKEIGRSKLEQDRIETAKMLLQKAQDKNVTIALTQDFVVVKDFNAPQTKRTVNEMQSDDVSLDIGPKTRRRFKEILAKAKTVVWNGPLGVFEVDAYAEGTKDIAEFVGSLTLKGVTTIIGGGDTAAAVAKFGLEEKFSHISTGGGASLEFLEGKDLSGIAALKDKDKVGAGARA